jgi:hypothetical protein
MGDHIDMIYSDIHFLCSVLCDLVLKLLFLMHFTEQCNSN